MIATTRIGEEAGRGEAMSGNGGRQDLERLKDPDSVSPQAGSGSASPRHERRGVVAAAVYQHGQRIRDIRIEEAGEWRSR